MTVALNLIGGGTVLGCPIGPFYRLRTSPSGSYSHSTDVASQPSQAFRRIGGQMLWLSPFLLSFTPIPPTAHLHSGDDDIAADCQLRGGVD